MPENRFFPAETAGKLHVVLSGRDRLLIERHRGIIGYTQERLSLRLEGGYMTVTGSGLEISEYGSQEAVVSGRIDALEFV